MEKLVELYESWHGSKPASIERLKGRSNREYYRLTADDGSTVIGVVGNKSRRGPCLHLSVAAFHAASAPRAAGSCGERRRASATSRPDLGNTSLFDAL